MVTGHKFRIHWGESLDFNNMDLYLTPLWNPQDKNLHLMTNFTQVRESINITSNINGEMAVNNSYTTKTEDQLQSGDNVLYNQTEVREFHFVLNGKNSSWTNLNIKGYECAWNCDLPDVVEEEMATSSIPWSDPNSWPSGAVPVADEEVEIPSGTWIEFDIEDSPHLASLTINGRLSFLNNAALPTNRTLNTQWAFVRAGELWIGEETDPYTGQATIKLFGHTNDPSVGFSMVTEGGNKGLFSVGLVKMYGLNRDQMSRLKVSTKNGDRNATVSAGLDWRNGDQVALMPTATQENHVDYMTIQSYDNQTGVITFEDELKFYHYGKSSSTGSEFSGVDMRGEVVLLSRNVRVVGNDTDSWGAQIVCSDTIELTSGTRRWCQMTLDNVECYNCSQWNTFNAGIRIENAVNHTHVVNNTVVWGGLSWLFSATNSRNIYVKNSYFIGARQMGVAVIGS